MCASTLLRDISQAGLGGLESVKQIQNEPQRRVVECERGPQPLDAGHGGGFGWREA
jgi:hypothetical protein